MATERVPQNLSSNDTDTPDENNFLDDTETPGPVFIDKAECRCTLQETLGTVAWRCIHIQEISDLFVEPTGTDQSGKWFFATNQSDPASLQDLPNSNRNPPNITTSYAIEGDKEEDWRFVEFTSPSDLTDLDGAICSGKNDTESSSAYYRYLATVKVSSESECWQPGTVALLIQNTTQWNATGCSLGFLCKLNNLNAKR